VYELDYQRPGALFQRRLTAMQTQKKPERLMGSRSGFFVVLPRGALVGTDLKSVPDLGVVGTDFKSVLDLSPV